jgi:hypothetical protein
VLKQANRKALTWFVQLSHVAKLSYEEYNYFEDSPRASWPRREGVGGCENPTSQFHTCVKGKAVKKFRDLLDGQLFGLGWRHQVIGFGL